MERATERWPICVGDFSFSPFVFLIDYPMPHPRPAIDANQLLAEAKRAARQQLLTRLCWGLVVLLLVNWTVMIWWGDSWWPGTLLLYGPRWLCLVPWALLLLASVKALRKTWLPLATAGLIILFPLMGFNIPFDSLLHATNQDPARLRIVTFNANLGQFKMAALELYLTKTNPDVVVCQEWLHEGPQPDLWKSGWHVKIDEHRMLIASRHPIVKSQVITEVELLSRGFVAAYYLDTPLGSVCIGNVHLPTVRGQAGEMDEVIHGKLSALHQVDLICERRLLAAKYARDWLSSFHGPMILAGDFNTTTDSAIYSEVWSRFNNAYSSAGWGCGYTKWTRWFGVRIDQVLYEKGWQCAHVEVGNDVGSDHLPLMAELVFTGGN